MIRRTKVKFRRVFRSLTNHGDSPERVARGVAAGFFAAAFPLPGLQIPISLLLAWIVRGNKTIAVLPQFLSNAGTMVPLGYLQFRIGRWAWPGQAGHASEAFAALRTSAASWDWNHPLDSMSASWSSVAALGIDVLGPLGLGVGITAAAMAMISYPLALVVVTTLYRAKMRRRHERGIRPPARPLVLPPPGPNDAPLTPEGAQRYGLLSPKYVKADAVKLLIDGDAFPEMLSAIACARRTVDLETYILRADKTGRRFAAALIAAARRGVQTRLLFDGVGGMGLPDDYIEALLRAGVQVRVYRPWSALWKLGLGRMNRRDHRKILVVDDQVGFTGGMNIADDYASREEGGEGWRDTHLRIDGDKPVMQLRALFNQTWPRAEPCGLPDTRSQNFTAPDGTIGEQSAPHGELAEKIHSRGTATGRNVSVQILSNKEFLQRVRIRRAYLHAINNAKRYILIENAYFIPDRGIRRALHRACKRGVVVAVVVARKSDVKMAALASRNLYGELLQNGVRLFEYPEIMIHSKVAVVDDIWAVVSTYNLDHRSLLHNLEAAALVLDAPVARALRDQVVADIGRCHEVSLQERLARPWRKAIKEALCYQLRYWL